MARTAIDELSSDQLVDLVIDFQIQRITSGDANFEDNPFFIADLGQPSNAMPTPFYYDFWLVLKKCVLSSPQPNPCKAARVLVYAKAGVQTTVFDNLDELETIRRYMPNAQLLLRIYANDNSALINFGD
ncbi:Mitochondrial 2-oxoadipate and 2-oxoglutarate transporter [Aspergillus hancockii]|nr:Mitochondrial 2-oxoadipate and 2-oxoglutarate transporter [Aspergillus hancockii]